MSRRKKGGGGGWYSFNAGDWHIISLNSNVGMSLDPATPQGQWLQADLAAHPTLCTMAFWHRPRFASNTQYNDTTTQTFWNLLYAAGADVVLNGHLHLYERFAPQTPTGDRYCMNSISLTFAPTES